jgi:hypothetical protein
MSKHRRQIRIIIISRLSISRDYECPKTIVSAASAELRFKLIRRSVKNVVPLSRLQLCPLAPIPSQQTGESKDAR